LSERVLFPVSVAICLSKLNDNDDDDDDNVEWSLTCRLPVEALAVQSLSAGQAGSESS